MSQEAEASGPLLLSYPDLKVAFEGVIAEYERAKSDGKITIKEWWDLLVGGVMRIVEIATEFGGLSPEDRKKLIVEGGEMFYNTVLAPIDIPGIPNFFETRVVDPMIGKAISPIMIAVIDRTLELIGRWKKPADTGLAPMPAEPDMTSPTPPGFKPY
jgi:hypothetical protein